MPPPHSPTLSNEQLRTLSPWRPKTLSAPFSALSQQMTSSSHALRHSWPSCHLDLRPQQQKTVASRMMLQRNRRLPLRKYASNATNSLRRAIPPKRARIILVSYPPTGALSPSIPTPHKTVPTYLNSIDRHLTKNGTLLRRHGIRYGRTRLD